MPKPEILTLCNYYLPGYRGGGPIRTICNLVQCLHDEFRFRVLTRDRDLGDTQRYSSIDDHGQWQSVQGAEVRYLSPNECGPLDILRAIRGARPDVLYLNTVFAVPFGVYPLLMNSAGLLHIPLIVAPRGQFAASALATRGGRKRALVSLIRMSRRFDDCLWQASCKEEAEDIRRIAGPRATVVIAPDIPSALPSLSTMPSGGSKTTGMIRMVFLSRLHPVKNLDYLLRLLPEINGQVSLDVFGPSEDQNHVQACKRLIDRLPSNITVSLQGSLEPGSVAETLARYDLFVLPTKGENFCHAVFESLSAGCPVLISDQTPWRNLEADRCGWDVPLSEPQRFQEIIQQVTLMSHEELQPLRQNATRVAGRFLKESGVRQQNVNLFHRAMQRSSPVGRAA